MDKQQIQLYASYHLVQRAIESSKLFYQFDFQFNIENPTILSNESYDRLIKFRWLDDEILCNFTDKYNTLSSHFFRLVQNQNYESAVRWFNNKIQYFNKNQFSIIINQKDTHWQAIHINSSLKLIVLSDSMGTGIENISILKAFVIENQKQLKFNFRNFDNFQILYRNGHIKQISEFQYTLKVKQTSTIVDVVDIDSSSEYTQEDSAENFEQPSSQQLQQDFGDEQNASISSDNVEQIENYNFQEIVKQLNEVQTPDQQVLRLSSTLKNFKNINIIDVIQIPKLDFLMQNFIQNLQFTKQELNVLKLCYYSCNMPTQDNGYDCGVFTIAFIMFCNGEWDEINCENSSIWRKKIIKILTK